jgi:precorrin-2 dehydrogenase / sirohydrochlorin ferrochelatase
MAQPATTHATRAGSAYPVVLDGSAIEALIVGGGAVAARKAESLLEAGARVRLVALRIGEACEALIAAHPERLAAERRAYRAEDIGDALLIVAATDDPAVNAAVARDAHSRTRLVNVADASAPGNCTLPAAHRAGPLTIAVSTGGVPGAASRIRDAIAERFDARYADALEQLADLRQRVLRERGREAWRETADAVIGRDFCESVERDALRDRVARWR